MNLLAQITIPKESGDAVIQLLHGDLTAIPKEYKADIVVVSAFPKNYDAVPGTLIGGYYDKGLVVADLAKDKDIDLVDQLGCWLSKPLSASMQEKFNFSRILCFEPVLRSAEHETVVGNIFRCINSFAFDDDKNVVALPVLATGNQKVPMNRMLPAILDAAIFWLESGLPLHCIKLVLYDEKQVLQAVSLFNKAKLDYESMPALKELSDRSVNSAAAEQSGFDYFISYAHKHSDIVNTFVENALNKKKDLNIFYDKSAIPPGGLWIKQISDAIQQSRKVLVFLSPDYNNSPVCWDEFQCAKLIEYNRKTQIIQTVYLYDFKESEMPPIMGIYSWIDCREGDEAKLIESISKLIN